MLGIISPLNDTLFGTLPGMVGEESSSLQILHARTEESFHNGMSREPDAENMQSNSKKKKEEKPSKIFIFILNKEVHDVKKWVMMKEHLGS